MLRCLLGYTDRARESRMLSNSLGFQEILVILAVVLIVFGPSRIPELARTLGRLMTMVRNASNELRRNLMVDVDLDARSRPRPARPAPPYQDTYSPQPPGPATPAVPPSAETSQSPPAEPPIADGASDVPPPTRAD